MRFQLLAVSLLLVCGVVGRSVQNGVGVKTTSKPDEYMPCKKQVSVYYDFSTDITATKYMFLQQMMETLFTYKVFNHYERLVLGTYSDHIKRTQLGDITDQYQINGLVENTKQDTGKQDMELLFRTIANNPENTTLPRAVILLVGNFTATDAKNVDHYAEQIKQSGTYLSMFGIQESVDWKLLNKVADFSSTIEVDGGIPPNMQQLVQIAQGCDF